MGTAAQAQLTVPNISRTTGLSQRTLVSQNVPLHHCKQEDGTNLPTSGDATVFGLEYGTHGSASPKLKSADLKSAGSTSRIWRLAEALSMIYDDANTIQIDVRARMTNVADSTATLDLECFETDDEAGIGSDLYSGSAVDVNSGTWTTYSFVIDATSLLPGDMLDMKFTFDCNDAAGGSEVALEIGAIKIRQDTRP